MARNCGVSNTSTVQYSKPNLLFNYHCIADIECYLLIFIWQGDCRRNEKDTHFYTLLLSTFSFFSFLFGCLLLSCLFYLTVSLSAWWVGGASSCVCSALMISPIRFGWDDPPAKRLKNKDKGGRRKKEREVVDGQHGPVAPFNIFPAFKSMTKVGPSSFSCCSCPDRIMTGSNQSQGQKKVGISINWYLLDTISPLSSPASDDEDDRSAQKFFSLLPEQQHLSLFYNVMEHEWLWPATEERGTPWEKGAPSIASLLITD